MLTVVLLISTNSLAYAVTPITSMTDEVSGFDELDGASDITTVVINEKIYALVASFNDDGIQIIDISDPNSPSPVSSMTDGVNGFDELDGVSGITSVVIDDRTYALVASYNDDGIQIIDITTPITPVAVASITDDDFMILNGASSVTTIVINDLTYALVASFGDDGVQIIDISNPSSPTLVSSMIDDVDDFNTLWGANDITTVVIDGFTFALVVSFIDNGIQIIDITDPERPFAISSVLDDDEYKELDGAYGITTVVINGFTYALVASIIDSGVQIIDITNPYDPITISSMTDGFYFNVLGDVIDITTVVIGSNTYALVTSFSDNGVQIIDITNPRYPIAIDSVTDGNDDFTTLSGASGITTVVIDGITYALVAAFDDDGVQIIDISSTITDNEKIRDYVYYDTHNVTFTQELKSNVNLTIL